MLLLRYRIRNDYPHIDIIHLINLYFTLRHVSLFIYKFPLQTHLYTNVRIYNYIHKKFTLLLINLAIHGCA